MRRTTGPGSSYKASGGELGDDNVRQFPLNLLAVTQLNEATSILIPQSIHISYFVRPALGHNFALDVSAGSRAERARS